MQGRWSNVKDEESSSECFSWFLNESETKINSDDKKDIQVNCVIERPLSSPENSKIDFKTKMTVPFYQGFNIWQSYDSTNARIAGGCSELITV